MKRASELKASERKTYVDGLEQMGKAVVYMPDPRTRANVSHVWVEGPDHTIKIRHIDRHGGWRDVAVDDLTMLDNALDWPWTTRFVAP